MAPAYRLRGSGRPQSNPVRKFFSKFEESTRSVKCLILLPEREPVDNIAHVLQPKTCGHVFKLKPGSKDKDIHAGNLEKHLKAYHKETYSQLQDQKRIKEKNKAELMFKTIEEAAAKEKLKESGDLCHYVSITKKKRNIQIFISPDDVHDAMIELVTEDGCPLWIVEKKGIRKLVQPILNKLPDAKFKKYNRHNIRTSILERSEEMKDLIKSLLNGRMFSLMLDCATRLERSFLGINCQFRDFDWNNGDVVLLTLALVELSTRSTAENLREQILTVLASYNLQLGQVVSAAVDNGANITKAVALLGEMMNNSGSKDSSKLKRKRKRNRKGSKRKKNEVKATVWNSSDDEIDNISCEELSSTLIEPENSTSTKVDYNYEHSSDASSCDDWDNPDIILSIESENNDENILSDEGEEKLRLEFEISEKLADLTVAAFESCNITVTRCAAHTGELAVADILEADPDTKELIDQVRNRVKKLRTSKYKNMFEIGKRGSKKFLLDVPTRWNSTFNMILRFKENKIIVDRLGELVPKYKFDDWREVDEILRALEPSKVANKSFQEQGITMSDFYRIWTTCVVKTETIGKAASKKESQSEDNLDKSQDDVETNKETNERNGDLEDNVLLDKIFFEAPHDDNGSSNDMAGCVFDELLKFLTEEASLRMREFNNDSLSPYWQAKKSTYPRLYKLVQIILAVPPTQVSVERLFSGLKYILSDLRNRMGEDLVEGILRIRQNKNVYKKINNLHSLCK